MKNDVMMAVQGSPTHRYFLSGQKAAMANLVCGQENNKVLVSRYFFFTDLRPYGCSNQRYFTVVSFSFDQKLVFIQFILDERSSGKV